jgi:hypothetical protein
MKIRFIILSVVFLAVLISCAKPSEPSKSDNILKIEKTLSTGGYARDLSISEELVFVAEDQLGFSIYNYISGTRFSTVDTINGSYVENVTNIANVLSEDLLYIFDTSATDEIHLYNISDLSDPGYVTHLPGDTGNLKVMQAESNPDGSTVVYWSSGVELKQATYDGSWAVVSYYFPNDIEGFDFNDEIFAIAGQQYGLHIAEKSNGNIISTMDTHGEALDVKIVDNYVILALREKGFMIVDITDPTNPQEIFSKDTTNLIYTVDAEDDYLLLSSHSGGIILYDISDISNPEYIGSLDSGDIGYTYNAKLHDGKIFAATRLGIQIITF